MKGINRQLLTSGIFLCLLSCIIFAPAQAQQKGFFPSATIQSGSEPPLPGDDHWSDQFSISGGTGVLTG